MKQAILIRGPGLALKPALVALPESAFLLPLSLQCSALRKTYPARADVFELSVPTGRYLRRGDQNEGRGIPRPEQRNHVPFTSTVVSVMPIPDFMP
jgi:hypothetical protein